MEASTAPACRAMTPSAGLKARGSHFTAKNKSTGNWPAMRICQMCAAGPSSASVVMPCKTIWQREDAERGKPWPWNECAAGDGG